MNINPYFLHYCQIVIPLMGLKETEGKTECFRQKGDTELQHCLRKLMKHVFFEICHQVYRGFK